MGISLATQSSERAHRALFIPDELSYRKDNVGWKRGGYGVCNTESHGWGPIYTHLDGGHIKALVANKFIWLFPDVRNSGDALDIAKKMFRKRHAEYTA